MKALISVNGHDIPDPSSYQGTTSTAVDSARNTEGYVVGAVIRDDIGKVSCQWNFITVQDWANILKLFSVKQGGSFTNPVTFFCQDTGAWETREMYVGDRSASIFIRNADGSIKGYKGAQLALVEV